jgi:hypothetical protein
MIGAAHRLPVVEERARPLHQAQSSTQEQKHNAALPKPRTMSSMIGKRRSARVALVSSVSLVKTDTKLHLRHGLIIETHNDTLCRQYERVSSFIFRSSVMRRS